ncbi:hypothetical protein [Chondromyces crocatus]|uniref:Uncharacterized protein n=1 Tax=Chondromyces crocatus TaxID=52 RepID=A0A0K1E6I9_CHOCO|nr:hypothetical protein [Chondromyces crocatus]AKT36490.1 uncharacterized protein CMC5_006060 [Chondromyces crocatus]
MGQVQLVLRGEFASHPQAARFAAEVVRIHTRYADEVVAGYQLCPFLRDTASGFGTFCVLLDREPVLETTLSAARDADSSVIHLVFPCLRTPAAAFERFAARVGDALRRGTGQNATAPGTFPLPPVNDKAPVMATFHPQMLGDASNAHRLVGLLRRAPDPFVQLIPAGLSGGGTVLAGAGVEPTEDRSELLYARLRGAGVEAIQSAILAIQADRNAAYSSFLEAFGLLQEGSSH